MQESPTTKNGIATLLVLLNSFVFADRRLCFYIPAIDNYELLDNVVDKRTRLEIGFCSLSVAFLQVRNHILL